MVGRRNRIDYRHMGKGKKTGRATSTLRTLFFFVAFVIAVISAQTWWEVRQDRQLTIDSEMSSSMVAVRSVEEHAERILVDVDRMLNSAAVSIQIADQHILEDDVALYQLLAREKQVLPPVQVLRFVDLTGVSRASSSRVGATEIELSDLQLRQVDANPAKPGYFVGQLMKSPGTQELILPIARNLYIRGQHVGMIVAELKVNYFFDFYKRITN